MISHEYKCIFIHISKCAGSTVETSFNADLSSNSETNNKYLFGWDSKHKLYLQHATPQELFDNGLIDHQIWNDYYKFIIVRNPWDRAYSDYCWVSKNMKIKDSFLNFIKARGRYKNALTIRDKNYRGDHLNKQIDYFYINGKEIDYDKVIRFENISEGLSSICNDLNLNSQFFSNIKKRNKKKKVSHYSYFFNNSRKKVIDEVYKDDITFFNYSFEDKKGLIDLIKSNLPSRYFLNS